MADWHNFIASADEWLVGYSVPPTLLIKPFMIGHVVELYLKAAYTKLSGDSTKAIGYGHKIKELWEACKELDSSFMLGYEFRATVFQVNLLEMDTPDSSKEWSDRLSQDDYEHFMDNQDFYVAAWLLPDLKYVMAPPKKNTFRLGFMWPSDYWITFLKSLRNYLGVPLPDRLDTLQYHIKRSNLPDQSINYLNLLYL